MAHREQKRSRHAGGCPWGDVELSSALCLCALWRLGVSRRLLRLPPCHLFCSVGCPGGWPNLLGSSAVARLAAVYGWQEHSAEIGARRALPRTAARRRGFLGSFSLPPRRLCRGWLEYLGEVVAVVASGRFSTSPALWGSRLVGAGACLSSFSAFPARRLNGRGA